MNKAIIDRVNTAMEARGHNVYSLRCGLTGTAKKLFGIAKLKGFNGGYQTFWFRLQRTPSATIDELSVPTGRGKQKPRSKEEVIAAIAALDARKKAMK